jgi:rare lipoprotein A
MKRALSSALIALAVALLAGPASASSYGWSTSYTGQEWMNGTIGGTREAAAASERTTTGKRAARKSASRDSAAPRGKRRLPAASYDYVGSGSGGQSGIASYYWQPQRVASGGWFNPNAMTAAHKTLPFGTKVRVTHASTGRSVTVTINDRGPYIAGRVIDLSSAAAGVIGMKGSGIARVNLTVLGR